MPKGVGSVVYGLDGEQITGSAWNYDLTEGIVFEPLPPAQMSDALKALQESLPRPETGLQIFPVRMGDEAISPLFDGLALYALKQTVPDGRSGVEHSVVRILLDPDCTNNIHAQALQDKNNFEDCPDADGLMLAAILWQEYSIEQHYLDLIDWNKTIPKAYRDFFATEGWVSCASQVSS